VIDRIRLAYPHLALGVYALEPGGDVTVEVFTPDGTRFAHKGPTEAEALTAIFGTLPEDPPPAVDPFD
jgi:hypothetical protein